MSVHCQLEDLLVKSIFGLIDIDQLMTVMSHQPLMTVMAHCPDVQSVPPMIASQTRTKGILQ